MDDESVAIASCNDVHVVDASIRFAKGSKGVLLLLAFLTKNIWLVWFILLGLFIPANFSHRYDLTMKIGDLLYGKQGRKIVSTHNALRFPCLLATVMNIAALIIYYFTGYANLAWYLILALSILMLLGGVGFCVGSILYAFLSQIGEKKVIPSGK